MRLPSEPNPPFQREVREWQRTDLNTGARLSGRIEAHRFNIGALKKYGQVVDSQNIMDKNGTQLTQRKQLEVFQARTGTGSLQVVKSSTVVSSTSRKNGMGILDLNQLDVLPASIMEPMLRNESELALPCITYGAENGQSNNGNNGTIGDIIHATKTKPIKLPLEVRPKLPLRRRKSPIILTENHNRQSNGTGSYSCVTKVKKDLENTLKQKNMLNEKLPPKIDSTNVYSIRNKFKIDKNFENEVETIKHRSESPFNKDNVIAESIKNSYNTNKKKENHIPAINITIKSTTSPNQPPSQEKQHHRGLSRIEALIENGRRRSSKLHFSSTPISLSPTSQPAPSLHHIKPINNQNKTIVTIIGPDKVSPTVNGHSRFQSKIPIRSKTPSKHIEEKPFAASLSENEPHQLIDNQLSLLPTANNNQTDNRNDNLQQQYRKVKFCKTEVHFTAETGRVTIVETDTKPPTTNLRRRHRSSGDRNNYRSSISMGTVTESRVPDVKTVSYETKIETTTTSTTTSCASPSASTHSPISLKALVDFVPKAIEELPMEPPAGDVRNVETFKGILTNKLVKPKSYHFGENISNLWGVQLRHVPNNGLMTRAVIDRNRNGDDENKKDNILVVVKRINDPHFRTTSNLLRISGYSTKVPINGHAICT